MSRTTKGNMRRKATKRKAGVFEYSKCTYSTSRRYSLKIHKKIVAQRRKYSFCVICAESSLTEIIITPNILILIRRKISFIAILVQCSLLKQNLKRHISNLE